MIEDDCLDLRRRAVGQRLLVRQLLQRRLAALVVECLEAFKAVAAVTITRQAWVTLPSCLASSSSPTLARMILRSAVMSD
jgi:hypothetical protein